MYRPDNQDSGMSFSRVLLVVGISIVFFAFYAYFFPQKPPIAQTSEVTIIKNENAPDSSNLATNTASNVSQNMAQNAAPQSTTNTSIASAVSSNPAEQILARVESSAFDVEIDALGRIKQVYLKEAKFLSNEPQSLFSIIGSLFGSKSAKSVLEKLPLFSQNAPSALEVRFSDAALNKLAFSTPYSASISHITLDSAPAHITLEQNLGELVIKKHITIHPNLLYDVQIELSKDNVEYFISNGMRPTADSDTYAFRGVITRNVNDGVLSKIEDGDASAEYIAKSAYDMRDSSFVASVDRYYTSLFFSQAKPLYVVLSGDSAHNPMPFVRFLGNAEFRAYIGDKDYRLLKGIDESLGDVVEYGRISFFAKPLFLLLAYLYDLCGNWGWAIVLLTLVVRIVLYPLTYRGMVSMQKLKDIAPKLKELQTRYKDDPQKLQMHMMDLYKKNGANPIGGCLPLLLQIPVFFAIYRVLHNAVELKSAEWILWIDDLSAIDPFFILPVLMGLSMYISQKLTPSNFTDPMQEKIFRMLPWIFMIFFIIFPFPAGLVLYWTVNNIFSIIQQIIINKVLEAKKLKDIQAHHKK